MKDSRLAVFSPPSLSPVVEKKNVIAENKIRLINISFHRDVTVTSPLQSTTITNAAKKSGLALEIAEEPMFNTLKASAKNKAFLYHSLLKLLGVCR